MSPARLRAAAAPAPEPAPLPDPRMPALYLTPADLASLQLVRTIAAAALADAWDSTSRWDPMGERRIKAVEDVTRLLRRAASLARPGLETA